MCWCSLVWQILKSFWLQWCAAPKLSERSIGRAVLCVHGFMNPLPSWFVCGFLLLLLFFFVFFFLRCFNILCYASGFYMLLFVVRCLWCARVRARVCVFHWHCSAQLSMFNIEKRYRNKIIIIIIIKSSPFYINISISIIWIYVMSHVCPASCPSCEAKTFTLASLTSTILIQLPLTYTLPGGHKVSAKQNLLASFSCMLFIWSEWN